MSMESKKAPMFLNDDGSLLIADWAIDDSITSEGFQKLLVDLGERPQKLAKSTATGVGTVSNGKVGADVIRLSAGEGFVPHTHPGDHLLIVIGGEGTVTYDGKVYPTKAGQVFMLEGSVPHAVGAITDHVILAVGSPHKPVDAADRMEIVEYKAIAAELEEVHCFICDITARLPKHLHDYGCPHCPCPKCNSIGS